MTETDDISKLRTFEHPAKAAIMQFLGERQFASTKDIAAATEIPRSSINEHLRRLEQEDLVECVERRPKRGALERVYRPSRRGLIIEDEEIAKLHPGERQRGNFQILHSALTDASQALSAAGDEHRDGEAYIHTRAMLDLQGWKELAAVHRRALEDMDDVRRASAERLRTAGGNPIRASIGMFLFELPDSA